MTKGLVSVLTLGLTALPVFVVAQQAPVSVPVNVPVNVPSKAPTSVPAKTTTPVSVPIPVPAVVVPTPAPAPASVATPAPALPTPPTPLATDITITRGGAATPMSDLPALPSVQLPPEMRNTPSVPAGTLPTAALPSMSTTIPQRPSPPAPPAKLTPTQIAQQIAPNFNVTRDYTRLTQCYGIADFMGAVTRIQASRPGATQQIVGVARSISGLQDAMQPMVLAASTVRGESRFRADYDAIARQGQRELATSRTPNTTMQRRLATLDACRADVIRWRGGR